jgi:hypothetical protein
MFFLGFNGVFAQDTEIQELRYFKSDDAFYLDNKRLLSSEIEMTLSKNLSALDAWKKGNNLKTTNKTLKVTTGVFLAVGGSLVLTPFVFWPLFLFNAEGVIGFFAVGGVLTAAGIVTGIMVPITKAKYKFCYSNATGIYNKSKNTVNLHIGTIGNGFGFSLKF